MFFSSSKVSISDWVSDKGTFWAVWGQLKTNFEVKSWSRSKLHWYHTALEFLITRDRWNDSDCCMFGTFCGCKFFCFFFWRQFLCSFHWFIDQDSPSGRIGEWRYRIPCGLRGAWKEHNLVKSKCETSLMWHTISFWNDGEFICAEMRGTFDYTR